MKTIKVPTTWFVFILVITSFIFGIIFNIQLNKLQNTTINYKTDTDNKGFYVHQGESIQYKNVTISLKNEQIFFNDGKKY